MSEYTVWGIIPKFLLYQAVVAGADGVQCRLTLTYMTLKLKAIC